ncbi:MAG: hypothetical protein Q4C82_00965, partial [Eubacteriales bacterium]|nr:hypothetical protein [Eubacteriales bacterium]
GQNAQDPQVQVQSGVPQSKWKVFLSAMGDTARRFFGFADELSWKDTPADVTDAVTGHSGDIKDITETSMDIHEYGLNGKAPDGSNTDPSGIAGATVSCINGLVAIYRAVQTILEMNKERKRRLLRNEEDDSHTAWQRHRKCIKEAVSVGTSVLDIVASFLVTPVKEVLGIIGNGLALLEQLVTIGDSTGRIQGVEMRKRELWKRIRAKREKYVKEKDTELAAAYSVSESPSVGEIKNKRDALRAKLAGDEFKTGEEQKKIASEKALTGKHRDVKKSYGSDYTTLSDKIMAEKKWAGGQSGLTGEERSKYKKRVRLMEALELIEQYYTSDQAESRQKKMRGHTIADAVAEGATMVANLTDIAQVFATGTVGVGRVMKIGIAASSLIRKGVSAGYAAWSERSGHSADKEFIRNEMAETLYESIKGLTRGEDSVLKADGTFVYDQMSDKVLASAEGRVSNLSSVLTTLDVSIAPLMTAASKQEMVSSLAAAFSQEGNG